MNLAGIFTKYNEKFNEIKDKYNNDYILIANDPEYSKYSREFRNLIRLSFKQMNAQNVLDFGKILEDNGVFDDMSKTIIKKPEAASFPTSAFAFFADSQYAQFILQQENVVQNVEDMIRDDVLKFDLSLVDYKSSIVKASNEYEILKNDIEEDAKELYKEGCTPKKSCEFYIDSINSPDRDETDKNEFANLVNLISSKLENNQIEEQLKEINKDPNFISALSDAKEEDGYDTDFIFDNKETFIKLLQNENNINALTEKELNNVVLFSRDVNRKEQLSININKEKELELEQIKKDRDNKISIQKDSIFDEIDDNDEFLKRGVKGDTLKNQAGDLLKQYHDFAKSIKIVKPAELTIGKNVVDTAKATFNSLINSANNPDYPQGINLQNIHEILKVISSLKINHENRPWYQKFFGYFFHVGSELREADKMSNKVAEMINVDRKLVDDAVKDTMLKKFFHDAGEQNPENGRRGGFVPEHEGAKNRYLKAIDDFRLERINVDPTKKLEEEPIDILTHKILEKQGIPEIVVTENDKYQQEQLENGKLKFVDEELNITQEAMRDQAIAEDLKVDFTKEDIDYIKNFDFEKDEFDGSEIDFKNIDNKYDFEDEYIKREDIEAVKKNLEDTKEMKISENDQYLSNFIEEKADKIDKFDTLDTNIQNLEPEFFVDEEFNFITNKDAFKVEEKAPTVVLKQEELNKKLNEVFEQNEDSKEVSKSNTNAPVNNKDIVID